MMKMVALNSSVWTVRRLGWNVLPLDLQLIQLTSYNTSNLLQYFKPLTILTTSNNNPTDLLTWAHHNTYHYTTTIQLPHNYHTATTQLPYSYHTATTQLPYIYHTATTQLPHSYHTASTQLPHNYHTVTTQLPHSYYATTIQLLHSYYATTATTTKLPTTEPTNPWCVPPHFTFVHFPHCALYIIQCSVHHDTKDYISTRSHFYLVSTSSQFHQTTCL